MDAGNVLYANHDGLVVFKFVGEIRYTMGDSYRVSASLDAFLDDLFESKDFENILIDLTETDSIDSTNLGLLAKIAQFTERHYGRKPTIISTNEDINAILDSVGFDQVFTTPRSPASSWTAFPRGVSPTRSLPAWCSTPTRPSSS
jgi:anti-anti-sigma factor